MRMKDFTAVILRVGSFLLDYYSFMYSPAKYITSVLLREMWINDFKKNYRKEMGDFFIRKDWIFLFILGSITTFIATSSVMWFRHTYLPTKKETYEQQCKNYQLNQKRQEELEEAFGKRSTDSSVENKMQIKAQERKDMDTSLSENALKRWPDDIRPDTKDQCGNLMYDPSMFNKDGSVRPVDKLIIEMMIPKGTPPETPSHVEK